MLHFINAYFFPLIEMLLDFSNPSKALWSLNTLQHYCFVFVSLFILLCFFRGKSLPQVEVFKDLGVLFSMSDGRMGQEMDQWVRVLSSVMSALLQSVVVMRELSPRAKLTIYWSVYVPPPSPVVVRYEL